MEFQQTERSYTKVSHPIRAILTPDIYPAPNTAADWDALTGRVCDILYLYRGNETAYDHYIFLFSPSVALTDPAEDGRWEWEQAGWNVMYEGRWMITGTNRHRVELVEAADDELPTLVLTDRG